LTTSGITTPGCGAQRGTPTQNEALSVFVLLHRQVLSDHLGLDDTVQMVHTGCYKHYGTVQMKTQKCVFSSWSVV
jgi:hypothetical protein